ncbi:hypothetical protein ACA910_005059 [Epithemia clementina (nom. ined.)]
MIQSKLKVALRLVGRHNSVVRFLSFSFAGPKRLNDVIKAELVQDMTGNEVADLWYSYHETKDSVFGIVLKGEDGKTVLSRASSSPFFIQPVFREDGFFNLISQFQSPSHFLLAYLEDYKMDPHAASPLLTFSVFDDYAESKDVSLKTMLLSKHSMIDHRLSILTILLPG